MRIAYREAKMAEMTEEMGERLMEKEREAGDNGILGAKSRVGLLTMKGMPWSQQENESMLWYDRFSIHYLPLEIGNRSIAKAYSLHCGKQQSAAPPDWYTMRKKWDWFGRAAAYDVARNEQRREMLDSVGVAIEDEIKEALLIGLRAAVERIESIEYGASGLDVKTAMGAIPRMAKELQDIYGVGKKAGATRSIEELLAGLPKGLGQRVMIYIDQRQQAQLPANVRGEIVEGEVREVDVVLSKRDKKLI